jgi:diacylglycerol kinase
MIRLWKALINSINGLKWALRHEAAVQEEAIAFAIGLPASFFVAASFHGGLHSWDRCRC